MYSEEATSENLLVLKLRDQFLAGDEEAYAQIYRLYARELYAFGLSMNVPHEFVEDAIHDIFVELYTRRENLRKVNNLKFYFITAFRNRLFFLINKSSKVVDKGNSFSTADKGEPGYEEIWIEKEIEDEKLKTLSQLLSSLNENQREAIYHRFIEGLSCDEISQIMGINYQSVKNLISRALKKMKSLTVSGILLLIFYIISY
jgi:RNA polymerase sigma factor (sigma-70 family)